MRLFIAIPLPKDIQKAIWGIQEAFRAGCASGDFVPEGNHHITLRLLGESDALLDIAAAMRQAVRDARPFTLRLGGLGSFPRGRTETAFLSVGGDNRELSRLYATLDSALWEAGFARGGRFTPHITLGRRVARDSGQWSVVSGQSAFRVNSIVLFESKRINGKMVYTPVHTETF
ncbi:MAG: RNA 2',3'-cyclic phosphodiesterase [Clostridiales bacterium]|nr:RNA 2',3'-cyclic phosphodiesterase [Clostridiales bacterium]